MSENKPVPGTGGDHYIPYSERSGAESVVFFTRKRTPEGLVAIYDRISSVLTGKVAVKLHTGEPKGPNIIPRPMVQELFKERLKDAAIVETNTYYDGDRYYTEDHRKTLKVNGWTFAPVDIMDEDGTAMLPVKGGKWFTEMSVGKNLLNYDSLLALTHFKGHVQGGFGGSNKNIGIGCADGRIGKAMIHTTPGQPNQWDIAKEEFTCQCPATVRAWQRLRSSRRTSALRHPWTFSRWIRLPWIWSMHFRSSAARILWNGSSPGTDCASSLI